jgi:hypothetical protein
VVGSTNSETTEEMSGKRFALLLSVGRYDDTRITDIPRSNADAVHLGRLLKNPDIGHFDRVETLLDRPNTEALYHLEDLLASRARDDLLFLLIASHMALGEDGQLFFLTSNTSVEHLIPTSVPADWLARQLERSRSARIVVVLDGSFSGAFATAQGLQHHGQEISGVSATETLASHNRVIIASSQATGHAFVRGVDDERPGSFTDAISLGLETSNGDLNGDGEITVLELFEYLYQLVPRTFPSQLPILSMVGGNPSSIVIAHSKRREHQPTNILTPLPRSLLGAMESQLATDREQAVRLLAQLTKGPSKGTREAAILALHSLADDDSRRVSIAARSAIAPWAPISSGGFLTERDRHQPLDWQRFSIQIRDSEVILTTGSGDANIARAGRDNKGIAQGRYSRVQYHEAGSGENDDTDIRDQLASLAEDVSQSEELTWQEKAALLPALQFFAEHALADDEPPEAQVQLSAIRQVGGWVWTEFVGLVDAMPAALAAAWMVELVKHAT